MTPEIFRRIQSVAAQFEHSHVVELGARVADGQDMMAVKPLFRNHVGIDMRDGAGVDIVDDITDPSLETIGLVRSADVVLCLETMEHIPKFWNVLTLFKTMKPGALLVFSAPSFGFPYHPHPIDCYRFGLDSLWAIYEGFALLSAEVLQDTAGHDGIYAIGVRQ